MSPHPLTIKSIELQGIRRRTSAHYRMAGCSCLVPDDPTTHDYALCHYHQGYDDGVEAALRPIPPARFVNVEPDFKDGAE